MSAGETKKAAGDHGQGVIAMPVELLLHDASQHVPDTSRAVWLVLEPPEGDLCWELGEWRESDFWRAGWYLVGTERPLTDLDYQVRYWCDEPPLTALPKQLDDAPVADAGGKGAVLS